MYSHWIWSGYDLDMTKNSLIFGIVAFEFSKKVLIEVRVAHLKHFFTLYHLKLCCT